MSPVRMSGVEKPIHIVLEFIQALNRHDVGEMLKFMQADCIFDSAAGPAGLELKGLAVIGEYWQARFEACPSAQIKVEDVFGLGFRTILRWRADWVTASGEERVVRGMDVFHIEKDLIRQQYSYVKGAFLDHP